MRLSLRLVPAEPAAAARLRRLLALLAVVAVSSLGYSYVYPPVAARLQAMQDRLEQERARLAALRREADAARGAVARLAEARSRLAELARRFPPRVDQPRLLEYLENAATAEGLAITKVDYGDPQPAEAYQRIPLEVTVSGPFAAQVNFALALQGMPWLYRFDGVALRGADQGGQGGQAPSGAGSPQQAALPASGPFPGRVEAVYKLSLYVDAPAPGQAASGGAPQGGGNPAGAPAPAGGQAAGGEQ